MSVRAIARPVARVAFARPMLNAPFIGRRAVRHTARELSILRFNPFGSMAKGVEHANRTQQSESASASTIHYDKDTRAHVYFLLDRSGSMSSIKDDVIGGFNEFLREQQEEGAQSAALNMTLVQFDHEDPLEVLFAARDIGDVPELCSKTFRPRGMTPLFDAIGSVITLAEEDVSKDANQEVIFVTFSDGHENASKEFTKKAIFSRIESKKKEGWTFVFLGANQDSYAQGGSLGFSSGNTQNFKFDGAGAKFAWKAVSQGCQSFRRQVQMQQPIDKHDFFQGVKIAEDDMNKRN